MYRYHNRTETMVFFFFFLRVKQWLNPQIGKQYENSNVMIETLVSQPKSYLNHENCFFLKKKKNTEPHGFIQIVWSLMLIFLIKLITIFSFNYALLFIVF